MVWQRPSPQVCELIRQGARIVLNTPQEWLDEYDRDTMAANPSIAEDPVLAAATRRSIQSSLMHWAAANVSNPGAPVPANLGPEPLSIARDMARRGLAPFTFRPAQTVGWRLWMDTAFDLTSDPDELRELLDVSFRSISDFIDATAAGIAAQMERERDELVRGTHAERREVTALILEGAPISRQRAEARLGYALNRNHTAAVVWSPEPDGDVSQLDQLAESFGHAAGFARPLTVVASAATRWVWVADATLDVERIHRAVKDAPGARIAIGTPAKGIEGFRRSHLEALTAQRMVAALRSVQQVAFFADVQLIALITQNPEAADDFIKNTLGRFESASPELHNTVLTFVNQQCSIGRTTKLLYTHRNTLLRRLDRAQQLLPRPLAHSSVHVAVALEALQWRGKPTP
ncbi:Rv1453 family transcriptional regulator [Mycobacterium szulgai]|uniref:Transcriptional regulator n=1 Tax=Mycobacterium szulgai TaxID=1787 RepID=A0A1X2DXA2_MYCSZ|nr:PucR family transcriptional regulator [Mycobacterium szulgai]MCV7075268.1 PucR family transcriptional regulator [Mycobacterium szulgai]ORW92762.1 transcriptional regulator [Mycobacterium szulgai]